MPFSNEQSGLLSQSLYVLRNSNQLCDITINVRGRGFPAHRAVLAACSDYYLAMFTSGFKESTQTEVSIDGDAEIFEVLLEFAYTGNLKITPQTAYDVLDMACYMQFWSLCKSCCKFIIECYEERNHALKMSLGDTFKISIFARNHSSDDHNMTRLATASDKYLKDNVQELKRTDEFLEGASVGFLEQFLNSEDLASATEEKQVLELVCNWLKHDWEPRHKHAPTLLQEVRLGLVSKESLGELFDANILGIPECKTLLDSVLELKSSKRSKYALARTCPHMFTTRSTINAPVSCYLSDSASCGMPSGRIHFYDKSALCWKPLIRFAPLPIVGAYKSLVAARGRLYCAGGLVRQQELDPDMLFHDSDDTDSEFDFDVRTVSVSQQSFYCYLSVENIWIKLASMIQPRHSFPMVYLDGYIYAIAGYAVQYGNQERTVERYSLTDNRWSKMPSLPGFYDKISAIAFRGKLFVYAVGEEVETYTLLVYQPGTKNWQTVLCEQHKASTVELFLRPPVIFVHKDSCYRILYCIPEDIADILSSRHPISNGTIPSVAKLQIEWNDDAIVKVTLGEDVAQEHIPLSKVGAFRIGDEVFMNSNGCVVNTGVKVDPGQTEDVAVYLWDSFQDSSEQSNITCFTFDRKLLEF